MRWLCQGLRFLEVGAISRAGQKSPLCARKDKRPVHLTAALRRHHRVSWRCRCMRVPYQVLRVFHSRLWSGEFFSSNYKCQSQSPHSVIYPPGMKNKYRCFYERKKTTFQQILKQFKEAQHAKVLPYLWLHC